jgi:polyhydroxyalkanoate synthesis regulator phasin
MTDQNRNEDPRGSKVIGNVLTVLLAGLGAVLLVEEGVERFVGRLIGENDSAAQDADGSSPPSRARSDNAGRAGVTGFMERRLESALRLANLPSHSEIARLSEQVDTLNRKVDRLSETEI